MSTPSRRRPSAIPALLRHAADSRSATHQTLPPPAGGILAPLSPDPGRWTIAALDRRFATFIDTTLHVERKSPDSVRGYKWAYANFKKFLASVERPGDGLGDRLFAIEEWVAWNSRRANLSGVTVNSLWRALRSFFNDLERRDALFNPFRGMKPPVMPRVNPKARSPEELKRILLAAEHYPWPSAYERARAVAILGTLIYAGLRKGELLRLHFADLDLSEGTIRVEKGKGVGGGKDRMAYVGPELHAILTAFLRERRRRNVVSPGLFASVGPGSGPLLSESSLIRVVRGVRRASGVPFSIHSLRHSFVTMLLKGGAPIHVVQALAGHSSIVTTMRYTRVWSEDLSRGAARISLFG
jgi:integrase